MYVCVTNEYCKISNIRRTKSPNLNVSHLVLQLPLPNPMKPGVVNEDVVGVAPPGNAPTTSEWSTILVPAKVRLILETWQYLLYRKKLQWNKNCFQGHGMMSGVCLLLMCRACYLVAVVETTRPVPSHSCHFNSLTPGRYDSTFGSIIFKPIIKDDSLSTCCEIALR